MRTTDRLHAGSIIDTIYGLIEVIGWHAPGVLYVRELTADLDEVGEVVETWQEPCLRTYRDIEDDMKEYDGRPHKVNFYEEDEEGEDDER